MNFLCCQHVTKEKLEKPNFFDNLKIYKSKMIPKTSALLKPKSDCINNPWKSELLPCPLSIFEFVGCPNQTNLNVINVSRIVSHVCLHWVSVIKKLG